MDQGARQSQSRRESGARDDEPMSIAGHVSRAMLSCYSHVRMEAKRRALDEIAVRGSGRPTRSGRANAERLRQATVVVNQRCSSNQRRQIPDCGPSRRTLLCFL